MIEGLSKVGGKVYHWLQGKDDYEFESEAQSLAHLNRNINNNSFRPLLPYQLYDDKTGIYHNNDSVGFTLLAAPLIGADENIQRTIAYLMGSLPDEAVLAITLYSSPKIGGVLEHYIQTRIDAGASSLHVEMAKRYADLLSKGGVVNIWHLKP